MPRRPRSQQSDSSDAPFLPKKRKKETYQAKYCDVIDLTSEPEKAPIQKKIPGRRRRRSSRHQPSTTESSRDGTETRDRQGFGVAEVPELASNFAPLFTSNSRSIASTLRQREIGGIYVKDKHVTPRTLVQSMESDLLDGPLRRLTGWVGASGDALMAAWSPDGSRYAVGCSADMDEHSAQYNRRNNLLVGDLYDNQLIELPDHHFPRPLPAAPERRAIYNALDAELFATITAVQFDPNRKYLYTASYDQTVKIWDLSGSIKCGFTLDHRRKVTHLATKDYLLCTGKASVEGCIRIYDTTRLAEGKVPRLHQKLESTRAKNSPMHLTALQISRDSRYLAAGFSEDQGDQGQPDIRGDLSLWDLETLQKIKLQPAAQSVHDIQWHPTLPVFAAAAKVGHTKTLSSRRTKSVVRTFSPTQVSCLDEYECEALDINDVSFHPTDESFIIASCTNGATYVWDFRRTDQPVLKLQHDEPIDELRPGMTREECDTGVRLALWKHDGKHLLTGSSDGILKSWNIRTSREDAFVEDVAHFNSGVMCGAWSPDGTSLLVGLAQGAVEILSTISCDDEDDRVDVGVTAVRLPRHRRKPIDFVRRDLHLPSPATSSLDAMIDKPAWDPSMDPTSGVSAARALLASSALTLHPIYGAGKGPQYTGPFAEYAHPIDPETDLPDLDALLPAIGRLQLDEGVRNEANRTPISSSNKSGRNAEFGKEEDLEESEMERRRYKNARKLAKARNVDFLAEIGSGAGSEANVWKFRGPVIKGEDPLEEDYWF
ncbi:hypothetical protein MMC25_000891 [Agyrium rufum]|nr:hypothetical protein [Agyrium rufum]